MTIQELIEIIETALEKDSRIKICHQYQAGKALQIQSHDGDNFNLLIVKLNDGSYLIKR